MSDYGIDLNIGRYGSLNFNDEKYVVNTTIFTKVNNNFVLICRILDKENDSEIEVFREYNNYPDRLNSPLDNYDELHNYITNDTNNAEGIEKYCLDVKEMMIGMANAKDPNRFIINNQKYVDIQNIGLDINVGMVISFYNDKTGDNLILIFKPDISKPYIELTGISSKNEEDYSEFRSYLAITDMYHLYKSDHGLFELLAKNISDNKVFSDTPDINNEIRLIEQASGGMDENYIDYISEAFKNYLSNCLNRISIAFKYQDNTKLTPTNTLH